MIPLHHPHAREAPSRTPPGDDTDTNYSRPLEGTPGKERDRSMGAIHPNVTVDTRLQDAGEDGRGGRTNTHNKPLLMAAAAAHHQYQ